jgi:glutamate synthase (NADPH) large chain
VRELMASLGVKKLEELIGRSDLLDQDRAITHWKAKGLDFAKLFHKPQAKDSEIYHSENQHHPLEDALDHALISQAQSAIDGGEAVEIKANIRSLNRTAGAMLSGVVALKYGHEGLPNDSIKVQLTGTAGQSFGAFLAGGITLNLEGVANDYVGKGLSGGKIIVKPPHDSPIIAEESIIVGNTVLYGAIAGEAYFRGVAGERFAVRNSGAIAVVEGTGDHGCEYMTGGIVVVIGQTGRNFAAGMSGGVAYVLDEAGDFKTRCNLSMVDLEPVEEEELLSERLHHHSGDLETKGRIDIHGDMSRFDEDRLRQLIMNHLAYTGSKRAQMILENWGEWRRKFVKVMPVEYRRALREMEQARKIAAE